MDVTAYRDGWADRRRREADEAELARATPRTVLPRLVELLTRDYGVDGVVLVGSLARGDFRCDSNIDLVARGLSRDGLFKAGAALERIAGRRVDLIPFEDATRDMLDTVAREGEVLHGQF